jgi:hypothetical protein
VTATRLAFLPALVGATMFAGAAQAAFINFSASVTNLQATAQTFAFTFGMPVSGTFNFGENSLTALVTDTRGDGASLTSTIEQGRLDGASVGLDLSFDCIAPASGANTCADDASGPFSATNASVIEVFFEFTLSPFDTASISGRFEVTQANTQVPEPGTLALLGAGMAALGLARRRRGTR